MATLCSSCKINIANLTGAVMFACPKCSESTIVRCPQCRKNAAKFSCANCKFEGPN